jgi:beta-lactam-binding protein with PASTA domain
VGRLWTNTGTLLATATFTNETASGWQQVAFSTPVAVTANTTYVASYHTNVGNYAVNVNYFATTGIDNAPLHALATGVSGGNGVFIYGASAFPTQTFNASNYWVDVVFTSASDTTPPTVTSVTPASGATGVSAATAVTATFSEAIDAATLTTGTFVLRNPANTVVASTVSYNAGTRVGTLMPSAALAASTTYMATITGGGSGVKDLAGNALASNVGWSFTTGPQMVNVPNVIGQTQTAAQSQITGAGLAVGTVTSQPSTTTPINTVINQSPTGGTQAATGSAVNLVISSGVTVPDVVGQPKATAESQITGAHLAVGTETYQSSPTVPAGAVVSQSPSGNTQASAGTSVNIVLSSGPSGVAAPTADQTVSSDGSGTRTTPPFSTASAGEVLLAFAASDGPATVSQTLTVSGAGLTWTLVKRINAQHGSSEIWWAIAPNILTNVTVTSTPSVTGNRQSLTVVTFSGAAGVGASAAASAASGAPTVSLTTTKANSLVYGVGNDWDGAVARVPGTGQTLVHQWVETVAGDTFWVQATAAISNSGTVVQVNDTAPTSDRWNLAAVEIVP